MEKNLLNLDTSWVWWICL